MVEGQRYVFRAHDSVLISPGGVVIVDFPPVPGSDHVAGSVELPEVGTAAEGDGDSDYEYGALQQKG
jgi:hypothetical protein